MIKIFENFKNLKFYIYINYKILRLKIKIINKKKKNILNKTSF